MGYFICIYPPPLYVPVHGIIFENQIKLVTMDLYYIRFTYHTHDITQPHRSMETSKLSFTGFCEGNSPILRTKASNAENISIWCRHHVVMTINGALDKPPAFRVLVNV